MKKYEEYKEFPEKSWQKALYDFVNLPIEEYLAKHSREMGDIATREWSKWMINYIEPAFDKKRHNEMIKNFGYSSIDKHDFFKQSQFYSTLKGDKRLDNETCMFIAFMAGTHFFDKCTCDIEDWFNSYYWATPECIDMEPSEKMNFTINEVLNSPYGLNYFKGALLGLSWWNR